MSEVLLQQGLLRALRHHDKNAPVTTCQQSAVGLTQHCWCLYNPGTVASSGTSIAMLSFTMMSDLHEG